MTRFSRGREKENQVRLRRKMEHCANARDESTQLLSVRCSQREATKAAKMEAEEVFRAALAMQKRAGEKRWSGMLRQSPYLRDMAGEFDRHYEEQEIRELVIRRKGQLMNERHRKARDAVFQGALAEQDDLQLLRKEKRLLGLKERELLSVRDVEKTQSRSMKIESDRRAFLLERQRALIEKRAREVDENGFYVGAKRAGGDPGDKENFSAREQRCHAIKVLQKYREAGIPPEEVADGVEEMLPF